MPLGQVSVLTSRHEYLRRCSVLFAPYHLDFDLFVDVSAHTIACKTPYYATDHCANNGSWYTCNAANREPQRGATRRTPYSAYSLEGSQLRGPFEFLFSDLSLAVLAVVYTHLSRVDHSAHNVGHHIA